MEKDDLLKKWLADELTTSEWENYKKSDDFTLNKEILENTKYFKASHFSNPKSYADFKSNLKNKHTPVIKLNSYKMLFRIAALFIISFSIYFAFFFNSLTTVKSFASQKINFELPDASLVILNADSKAKYNKKKWKNKREITLEGEAFFKVAKGAKFDVITLDGVVSVLGTQFNVKNRKNYFEVVCFEGKVSVVSSGHIQLLTKGKTIRILNGIVSVDSIPYSKPQWVDNISSFKSVPFYEVINEFERQYNVKILIKNKATQSLFTGAFVHDDIDQALTAITEPFNLTYTKDSLNKITIFSE